MVGSLLGIFVTSMCAHGKPLDVFDATEREFICVDCCVFRVGHKFQRPHSQPSGRGQALPIPKESEG